MKLDRLAVKNWLKKLLKFIKTDHIEEQDQEPPKLGLWQRIFNRSPEAPSGPASTNDETESEFVDFDI